MRILVAFGLVLVYGCTGGDPTTGAPDGEPGVEQVASLDPPAVPGSFAPDLWSDEQGLVMTWLEPLGATREEGHRVRFARFEGDRWSTPVTVFQSTDLFANWADFPSAARTADGTLYVHWLGKTAPDTFAYSIFLARSADGGTSWQLLGKLNDDSTHTEHGFVSWVREGDSLRAFWLDGREMVNDEPMGLRSALVSADGTIGASEVLDSRVCECCSTDAAVTAGGPLVVYRDRGEDEVRDVFGVAGSGGEWRSPSPIAEDGWRIEGCPVNGPEIAAAGDQVFVTWFTAAGDQAQVRMTRSLDGGVSFEDSSLVDDDQPLGRVDVTLSSEGEGVLAWLGRHENGAAIFLQTVGAEGTLGERREIAETSPARASGFPRLATLGESIVISWVELVDEAPSTIRFARLEASQL